MGDNGKGESPAWERAALPRLVYVVGKGWTEQEEPGSRSTYRERKAHDRVLRKLKKKQKRHQRRSGGDS